MRTGALRAEDVDFAIGVGDLADPVPEALATGFLRGAFNFRARFAALPCRVRETRDLPGFFRAAMGMTFQDSTGGTLIKG